MKLKDILNMYTTEQKYKIFTNAKGIRTSIRLNNSLWEILDKWCKTHKISIAWLLRKIDEENDGVQNLTQAVKTFIFYIKENPKDEIIL